MASKLMLLLVATLALSINAVNSSTIYRSFTDEEFEDSNTSSTKDFDDEPIYQPRFLPFFQDNAATIGKVVEALQNPGNKTLQDTLFNLIADVALKQFGGDETVKKVIEVVKNSQNKTFREIVMDVAAEVAITKLGGEDETIRKIAEVLKNPGNKTMQENLINLAADIADTKLKGDGTLNKVAEILQRPGNRTLQENLLNVVFEVGVSKYGDNQLFKTVAEVYRNSGNKTLQENILNLATNVALTQYGNNPIIKMVATSLQNSGNGTLNDKLSAMADAALTAGLGPVQAAIIKQGIGIAGQALKVGGSLLGEALSDIGGDSALGKAGRAIGNGSLAVGGAMSNYGGGDKGLGAVIEKFGDSLKGENVTVQEAFQMVGSTMDIPVSTVEKDLSEGIQEAVKTEDKLVEVATNVLTNVQKAPQVNTEPIKVEATENNKPVDVDQSTLTEAQVGLGITRAGEDTKYVDLEQNNKPLTTSGLQALNEKKTVDTNNDIAHADKAVRVINNPVGLFAKEGRSLETGVNQDMSYSKQTTPGSQTTINNFGARTQNSEITTGMDTNSYGENVQSQNAVNQGQPNFEGSYQDSGVKSKITTDSFNRNPYYQSAVAQSVGTNNFGGSFQNNQVSSAFVADTSRRNVFSENVADQGSESSSSVSALGSAAQAIEAARQALQAGGEALGGALGSVGSSSGSSGMSMRQNGGVMNIEITQVKLKMM